MRDTPERLDAAFSLRAHHLAWLGDYIPLIGEDAVRRMAAKADAVASCKVSFINSTKHGGGVVEIMRSLTPLLCGLGIHADWTAITGQPAFFDVTKNIHNLLQGKEGDLSPEQFDNYISTVDAQAGLVDELKDIIFVHDPQPLPLIRNKTLEQHWIWCCHLDLTNINRAVWNRLKPMVDQYDSVVFSMREYHQEVKPKVHFITPAIDPFSVKNRTLDKALCRHILQCYQIPLDKPIVSQVSRFDPWKDQAGVIEAANIARRQVDFTLVLLGNMADDDPEGKDIFDSLQRYVDERTIISCDGNDQLLVNALQSMSAVVVKKSTREGFGMTCTEAMWKGRPVIAGKVGGLVAQITDGENGYLVNSVQETADRLVTLIKDPCLQDRMGINAKKTVRERFLLTTLLERYLDLFTEIMTSVRSVRPRDDTSRRALTAKRAAVVPRDAACIPPGRPASDGWCHTGPGGHPRHS